MQIIQIFQFLKEIDYSIVAYLAIFSYIVYVNRKKVQEQKIISNLLGIVMIKTKAGLALMSSMATKHKKLIRAFGYLSIGLAIIGMVFIVGTLGFTSIKVILKPATPSGVTLVLPGMNIPGIGYLPFWHWIISIFILALIHEFSHGVVARSYGIKVKSSGIAAVAALWNKIPIIPAAFVEPDEKQLKKAPEKVKYSIFAAGPASNIILALLIIPLLVFVMIPAYSSILDLENTTIVYSNYTNNSPAYDAGLRARTTITRFDAMPVNSSIQLLKYIQNLTPGDIVQLGNDKVTYNITTTKHPDNASKAYLGISLITKKLKAGVNKTFFNIFDWFIGLFIWLHALNLGIGLFNLLPMGPVDGGLMLKEFLTRRFKKKKAMQIFKNISIAMLLLVIFLLLSDPLQKLFSFLF